MYRESPAMPPPGEDSDEDGDEVSYMIAHDRDEQDPVLVVKFNREADTHHHVTHNNFSKPQLLFAVLVGVFSSLIAMGAFVSLVGTKSVAVREHVERGVRPTQVGSDASSAFGATMRALEMWVSLVVSVLVPTSHHSWVFAKEGYLALEPSLKLYVVWLWRETSTKEKLVVLGLLGAAYAIWRARKELIERRVVERIGEQYDAVTNRTRTAFDRLQSQVSTKSRFAARMLSHLLFAVAALAGWYFFPHVYATTSRGFVGWAVVILVPGFGSVRALDRYERLRVESSLLESAPAPPRKSRRRSSIMEVAIQSKNYVLDVYRRLSAKVAKQDEYKRANASINYKGAGVSPADADRYINDVLFYCRYWSVLGVALLLEQMPFTGHLLSYVSYWPVVRCIAAVWLQFPGTCGADFAYHLVVPFLNKYVKKVESPVTVQQQNVALNMLATLGILSAPKKDQLAQVLETGGTLAVTTIPFLFTPAFICRVGILLVGLANPIHNSVVNLKGMREAEDEADAAPVGTEERSVALGTVLARADACAQNLEYWIVYAVVVLCQSLVLNSLFAWWLPLYQQTVLLGLLFLQIPYFRGAHTLFAGVAEAYRFVLSRVTGSD